jgi:hypothetical protein
MKKIVALFAAAGMAAAPVAASAQNASALSPSRAAAPMLSGFSFLQDDADEGGGGSTAVILGLVIVLLIGIAAISGNGNEPNNPPQSP